MGLAATVSSRGALQAYGSASGTTVLSGAVEYALSGGILNASHIAGFENIFAGGSAVSTTLNSGGNAIVFSGGADIAAHVNSGGMEVIFSGGIASAAIISGGTIEVHSGGSTGSGQANPVTFASSGGGTLLLLDSVSYGGFVAGFGQPDFIDLRDIAFGGSTSVTYSSGNPGNTSGTLIVTDGAHTANINLLGQYTVAQFLSERRSWRHADRRSPRIGSDRHRGCCDCGFASRLSALG